MTHSRSLAVFGALGVLTVTALTSCGTDTDSPTATTTSAAPIPITYHPCDDLSFDALEEVGFSVRSPYRTDRQNPISHECTFAHRDPGYGASFSAMGRTFDDVVADQRLEEHTRIQINGRDVSIADFTGGSNCLATMDIEPGVLQFSVTYSPTSDRPDEDITTIEQACSEAERILTALAPHLPDRL
ncbi:DUF3558 domain-containing protein [Rhodococcus triatomae]|uniref:DUF3558 domain-containing protein n=1 Tax=Rhodococcus triatomae TaxID=300028 RepID=A0A1G8RJ36_9NOCA|nr:DUF3558 family protein [Rhodococcus triatomae]QNG19929.1 DUF3558 domain-containing protein [Rhodococcus triatomae]QNG24156.1 DUF3558 domain-containing protein [Rhodococcus triatomae]SDJ17094.1 Protein of unknown function [Rhodococcus triatomae]